MAGQIKGITIEFDGNTTKLDNAIKSVNKNTRALDSELRKINTALKFNPTSIELWRLKQENLKDKISETEKKLKALKDAQDKADASGVDKQSQEYRELQREIIETESKLKTFNGELKKIGNANLRAVSEGFRVAGEKLEAAGQAMVPFSAAGAAVVGTLGTISYKAGTAADDLNTMAKVTGISTQELQKYAYAADLVDVSTEAIAKSQKRLSKSAYDAANGSKAQAENFEKLGISVKDADGNLKDSEVIFEEVIASLSQMENETERNALAQKIMGKAAAELNPLIEDGGETYKMVADTLKKYNLDYVDQETLDKANEFNDSLDTMKLIGQVAISQAGSQLAGYLAPALEKVVDLVGRFAEWLSKLDPAILTIVGAIGGLLAVTAPLLIGLGKIAFAISSIMGVAAKIAPVLGKLGALFNPWTIGIAAAIAAGILIYKNWDKIKAYAKKLWTTIKPIFQKIGDFITQTWQKVKDAVTQTWTNIVKTIQTKLNQAKQLITTILNACQKVFTTVLNAIKAVVTAVFTAYVTIIRTQLNIAKTVITTILNAAKQVFTTVLNAIKAVVTALFTAYVTIIRVQLNIAKTVITTILNACKQVFTSAFNAMKTVVTTVLNAIKSFISSSVGSWKNIVTSAVNAVKNAISNGLTAAKNTATNIISNIKNAFSTGFSNIAGKVRSAFTAVKDAITSPIQKAWDLVKSAIDKIKGIFPIKLGKIFSGIKLPHFKISGGKVPWGVGGQGVKPSIDIEWYKKGGIFTRPTVFATGSGFKGVGEAGAEAVLPLDTLWEQMAGMGNTIVQGVTANQQRQDQLLEQLVTLNALMLEQLKADKDFRIDGRVAGRIINDLVRV